MFKGSDEDLAITDLAGVGDLDDGFDDLLGHTVVDRHLKLHLGQKVDHVLGSPVQLGVALLTAKALHFSDGDALNTDLGERLADVVELEWLDNRGHQFHGGFLILSVWGRRRSCLAPTRWRRAVAPVLTSVTKHTPGEQQ